MVTHLVDGKQTLGHRKPPPVLKYDEEVFHSLLRVFFRLFDVRLPRDIDHRTALVYLDGNDVRQSQLNDTDIQKVPSAAHQKKSQTASGPSTKTTLDAAL